jgi:hypothetical protein
MRRSRWKQVDAAHDHPAGDMAVEGVIVAPVRRPVKQLAAAGALVF